MVILLPGNGILSPAAAPFLNVSISSHTEQTEHCNIITLKESVTLTSGFQFMFQSLKVNLSRI